MANAHDDKHLQGKQACNFPTDYPQSCTNAALNLGTTSDTTDLLDTLCSDACRGPLDDYYKCLGIQDYSEYLCLQQNNQYCYVTFLDVTACLASSCSTGCNDDCSSCLDDVANDFSCCADQYQHLSSSVSIPTIDICGNSYGTCSNSGGATAVPTVLAALLLMVMAIFVM